MLQGDRYFEFPVSSFGGSGARGIWDFVLIDSGKREGLKRLENFVIAENSRITKSLIKQTLLLKFVEKHAIEVYLRKKEKRIEICCLLTAKLIDLTRKLIICWLFF